MELKLNIYETRLCRKVEKTVAAQDFELSVGICEEVLRIINIDMFDGGLSALSKEALNELALDLVKDGFPFFVKLIKEIFDITDDEVKRVKLSEVAAVVVEIVKYSFNQLMVSLGAKKVKN